MQAFRKFLLTLLAIVLPGLPQLITRRYRASGLIGIPFLALAVAIGASIGGAGFVGTALDPGLVMRIGWMLVAGGALAAVSVTDTAIHVWDRPFGRAERANGMARVAMASVVPLLAGVVGLNYADRHSTTINRVFVGGATRALPTPLPDDDALASPAEPGPTTTTVPETPETGRWNVLLLGGDGGKGRFSVRTDSMIVLSIDKATGDTAMVSVPRNLERLPLPEGDLKKKNPKGWPDIANSLYEYLDQHKEFTDGTSTGAGSVLKGAIAEAVGQPIDNFILVNMGGFIDVLDALGGVTINIGTTVPSPGNPAEAKHPVPAFFKPGVQHLDGTNALAYSRSRYGDSDYKRMARQRCLLAAAARQINPIELLRNYDSLLGALNRSILSDLSPAEARKLITLFQRVDSEAIRSLGLVPPLVNTGSPNYKQIRELVQTALYPPPPEPETTTTTAPPSTTLKPGSTTTTTTTIPVIEVLTDDSSC
ncbi:MAG: LCP family protein [Acidimicrobiia bacterium]